MVNAVRSDAKQQNEQFTKDNKTIDTHRHIFEEEDLGTDKQPRLSFYYNSSTSKQNTNREKVLEEIDRVEQLITLNLQKINENLMLSNSIIGNKLIPTIENFNRSSCGLFNNTSHIKEFFENAANVNILTKKDIEPTVTGDEYFHRSSSFVDEKLTSNAQSTSFELMPDAQNHRSNSGKLQSEANVSSELSDLKNIKDRYKQNVASSSHDITDSTEILKRPVTPVPAKLSNNSFNIEPEDESTGRHATYHMGEKASSSDFLQLNPQPFLGSTNLNEGKGGDDAEIEVTSTSKYVKDMMSGYESPPWEEPPLLQSAKFSGVASKGQKRQRSSDAGPSARGLENPFDERTDRETTDALTMEDNEENEEEDVSIRFPSSPKYGAGGKLLRTEKGRQIALDFARSEIMKDHPILSLQHTKSDRIAVGSRARSPSTTNFAEEEAQHSSSFEDLPELLSEKFEKRLNRS